MTDTDVKNTLEQMWRAGFAQGFHLGREGTTGDKLPPVRFEWRDRQPIIHIERPSVRGGLWTPK